MARAALLLLLLLSASARADDVVRLRPRGMARGRETLLSDVADVPSGCPLADLPVGPTPAPGQPARLTRAEVRARLAEAGRSDLAVLGPEHVLVEGETVPLDGEALSALARDHALAALAAPGVDVQVLVAAPAPTVAAPVGRRRSALVVRWQDERAAVGRVVVEVVVLVDGQPGLVVPVALDVRRAARGAVAARGLKAGRLLAAGDLGEALVELAAGAPAPAPADALVGAVLRRPARAGQPVGEDDVGPPPVVRRGDRVTVSLDLGALVVTSVGTAGADGAPGEVVPVLLPGRAAPLAGRVTAPGEVRVSLQPEGP